MQAPKNTSRQGILILASKKDAQKRQQAQKKAWKLFFPTANFSLKKK